MVHRDLSVPESMRSRQQQVRSHLTALGFGTTGTATRIASARTLPAERAIAGLDLAERSAVVVGADVAGRDLRELLAQSRDLDGIDGRSPRRTRSPPGCTSSTPGGGSRSAAPGLPQDLWPAGRSGRRAAALFEHLVASLEGRALAFAVGPWPGA